MDPGALYSRVAQWIAVTLLAPLLLVGCSSLGEVKHILREASGTLTQIVTLILDDPDSPTGERLYAAEDRIHLACRDLLESAHRKFERDEIPLETRISAAFTAERCERAVEEAQREIQGLGGQSALPDP